MVILCSPISCHGVCVLAISCHRICVLGCHQARVVELVKENRGAVTLAIGDGANDVGMIKGKG